MVVGMKVRLFYNFYFFAILTCNYGMYHSSKVNSDPKIDFSFFSKTRIGEFTGKNQDIPVGIRLPGGVVAVRRSRSSGAHIGKCLEPTEPSAGARNRQILSAFYSAVGPACEDAPGCGSTSELNVDLAALSSSLKSLYGMEPEFVMPDGGGTHTAEFSRLLGQLDHELSGVLDPAELPFELSSSHPSMSSWCGLFTAAAPQPGAARGVRPPYTKQGDSEYRAEHKVIGGFWDGDKPAAAWVFSSSGVPSFCFVDTSPSPALSQAQHCLWAVSCGGKWVPIPRPPADFLPANKNGMAAPANPPSPAARSKMSDIADLCRESVFCARAECAALKQAEARSCSWMSRPFVCRCIRYAHKNLLPTRDEAHPSLYLVDSAAALMGGDPLSYTHHSSALAYGIYPKLVPGVVLQFDSGCWEGAFGEGSARDLDFPQVATVLSRTKVNSIVLQFKKDAAKSHYRVAEAGGWGAEVAAGAAAAPGDPPQGSIYARVRAAHVKHGGELAFELWSPGRGRSFAARGGMHYKSPLGWAHVTLLPLQRLRCSSHPTSPCACKAMVMLLLMQADDAQCGVVCSSLLAEPPAAMQQSAPPPIGEAEATKLRQLELQAIDLALLVRLGRSWPSAWPTAIGVAPAGQPYDLPCACGARVTQLDVQLGTTSSGHLLGLRGHCELPVHSHSCSSCHQAFVAQIPELTGVYNMTHAAKKGLHITATALLQAVRGFHPHCKPASAIVEEMVDLSTHGMPASLRAAFADALLPTVMRIRAFRGLPGTGRGGCSNPAEAVDGCMKIFSAIDHKKVVCSASSSDDLCYEPAVAKHNADRAMLSAVSSMAASSSLTGGIVDVAAVPWVVNDDLKKPHFRNSEITQLNARSRHMELLNWPDVREQYAHLQKHGWPSFPNADHPLELAEWPHRAQLQLAFSDLGIDMTYDNTKHSRTEAQCKQVVEQLDQDWRAAGGGEACRHAMARTRRGKTMGVLVSCSADNGQINSIAVLMKQEDQAGPLADRLNKSSPAWVQMYDAICQSGGEYERENTRRKAAGEPIVALAASAGSFVAGSDDASFDAATREMDCPELAAAARMPAPGCSPEHPMSPRLFLSRQKARCFLSTNDHRINPESEPAGLPLAPEAAGAGAFDQGQAGIRTTVGNLGGRLFSFPPPAALDSDGTWNDIREKDAALPWNAGDLETMLPGADEAPMLASLLHSAAHAVAYVHCAADARPGSANSTRAMNAGFAACNLARHAPCCCADFSSGGSCEFGFACLQFQVLVGHLMVCENAGCALCCEFDRLDSAAPLSECMRVRLFFSNPALAAMKGCVAAYVASLPAGGWPSDPRKVDGRDHKSGGELCNPCERHCRRARQATRFYNAHDGFHAQGHKCETCKFRDSGKVVQFMANPAWKMGQVCETWNSRLKRMQRFLNPMQGPRFFSRLALQAAMHNAELRETELRLAESAFGKTNVGLDVWRRFCDLSALRQVEMFPVEELVV